MIMNKLIAWLKTNKNPGITLLLVMLYFLIYTIILNDLSSYCFFLPLIVFILVVKLAWDPSSQLISSILVFLVFFLCVNIFNSSFKTKSQHDLNLLYNLYQMKRIYSVPATRFIEHKQQTISSINVSTRSDSYNIFFLETNHEHEELTAKELCSVESAIRNNPDAQIHLLTIRADFGQRWKPLSTQFGPNFHLQRFMPFDLFNNTPLIDWYLKGDIFKSKYLVSHMTDAARFSLLYKYGGVYSDLDTITLKSFEPLIKQNNVNGGAGYLYEEGDSLGAGVLLFKSAHPFLKHLLERLSKSYDPYEWGSAGPLMLISSLKDYCQTDNIYKKLVTTTPGKSVDLINKILDDIQESRVALCQDIVIYPENYFYPYHYRRDLPQVFEPQSVLNISRMMDVYSIHLYGKFSTRIKVKPGDKSLFDYLASVNCPKTYNFVKSNSFIFE